MRKQCRCLVCGDDVEKMVTWSCTLDCKFRVHEKCAFCLEAVLGETWSRDTFRCEHIAFQMHPHEVLSGSELNDSDVARLRSLLVSRGKVNTAKYSVKTKRWVNEEVNCRKCHRWYGLNETDHHATYCTGVVGTPLPRRDTPYLLSRCKRFRHLAFKTP